VTTAATQRALPQQVEDLKYLLGRLEARGKDLTGARDKLNECWATDQFTVDFAASMIRLMLDMTEELDMAAAAPSAVEQAAGRPTVPAGRYAVLTEGADSHYAFYRVWCGNRGGVVVYLMTSDDEQRIVGHQATTILHKINADLYEASCAYGREIGICGRCNRTLTKAESITRGMGDICASKF
jgi:hypothetical protein